MAGDAIGHGCSVAFLKNPNAWGTKAAVAGAGHGIEIDRSSLRTDSQLIELMGVTGKKTQMPALKGNELTAGDLGPMDLYYDGCQRMLAMVQGIAGVPTTPAGGTVSRLHVFKMQDSYRGLYGTLVEKNPAAIREWPFLKLTGFTIECESGQAAKLTVSAFGSTINYNQGTSAAANLVASVAPALNPAFTLLLASPPEPSPIRLTYTVGTGTVTEWVVTVTGLDVHGDLVTVTYRKSVDGLVWDSPVYFTTILAIAGATPTGTVGTDMFTVGYSNGLNNDTTVASITYPADRNMAVFAGLSIQVNDQSAGALSATFLKDIRRFRLSVALNLKQSVTTRGHRITDEPLSDGFTTVELGFGFERWSTTTGTELNHDTLKDYLKKTKKKMKVEWQGPVIEGLIPYRLTAYLNNVVLTDGQPNFAGPGQMALDITGRAYRATAIPTGFPTGYTDPLTLELQNQNVSDALA